jgi:ABC-2 type transport system permease protein
MSAGPWIPRAGAPSNTRTLGRLFLMLFLRGRGVRGLQQGRLPSSIARRLGLTLIVYLLFGLFAFAFASQPILALAVYLHVTTFIFLGLFVASSAGEILFNKDEADILLHRPVSSRELLWAKVSVLVLVSVWLAGAFNLAGLYVGWHSPEGGWRFPVVHALSTVLEALFCCGCVVLTYQLCLRWFGRERLEGLMTAAQVVVSIALVLSGQLMPRMLRLGLMMHFDLHTWWVALLPPAWFAGLDDALAGTGSTQDPRASLFSWILAALALLGSALVLWAAFVRLARDYTVGLQSLGEAAAPPARRGPGPRWTEVLVGLPPLSWWLRDPVERAAFSLSLAYLLRDREVKLRVYPGTASLLAVPLVAITTNRGMPGAGFMIAFGSSILGLAPMTATKLLQYSQQWQAADLFRMAPMAGPAPLCRGATRAVQCVLTIPFLLAFLGIALSTRAHPDQWWLLLPGLISLPVYSMIPGSDGEAVPLSRPGDEARSASRGLVMMAATFVSILIAAAASWAWRSGWFWQFVGIEAAVGAFLYTGMRRSMLRLTWSALE